MAVADLLFDADYDPALRAGVPGAVRAALAGDAAPLLRLVAAGDALASLPAPAEFSSARYAAVCEETPLPWDAATPLGDRLSGGAAPGLGGARPGAFRPFDFDTAAADEIELCLHWPARRLAHAGRRRTYPAVPTLLLQGGEDLRTPPEVSARVAARLPGAQRVLVPGVGHGTITADSSGCAANALVRFLAGDPGGRGLLARADGRAGGAALPPVSLRVSAGASRSRARCGDRADARRRPLRPVPGVLHARRAAACAAGRTATAAAGAWCCRATRRSRGVRVSGRWHGRRLSPARGRPVRGGTGEGDRHAGGRLPGRAGRHAGGGAAGARAAGRSPAGRGVGPRGRGRGLGAWPRRDPVAASRRASLPPRRRTSKAH